MAKLYEYKDHGKEKIRQEKIHILPQEKSTNLKRMGYGDFLTFVTLHPYLSKIMVDTILP